MPSNQTPDSPATESSGSPPNTSLPKSKKPPSGLDGVGIASPTFHPAGLGTLRYTAFSKMDLPSCPSRPVEVLTGLVQLMSVSSPIGSDSPALVAIPELTYRSPASSSTEGGTIDHPVGGVNT